VINEMIWGRKWD